jgi:hypothetical protein
LASAAWRPLLAVFAEDAFSEWCKRSGMWMIITKTVNFWFFALQRISTGKLL